MKVALVVDNPYRDLPGLVLTAMRLCQYGITCYLVPMNLREIEIWSLVPDFVLLNYLRINNQEFARELMTAGIQVGVLDTEGGVLTSLDSYEKTMASDAFIRHGISCFCTWGNILARSAVTRDWYAQSQVCITGTPRFDFYHNLWREAALRNSTYVDDIPRPIVLVNGNFPLANPKFRTPEQEVRMYVQDLGYEEEKILALQQSQTETMMQMIELTNQLVARFPKVSLVYRPHPFENVERYKTLIDSRDNLRLVKRGTVDGWILRASAVIQRSCSTAIEAGLAGVPAFSPKWIPVALEMENAESVSISCMSLLELEQALEKIFNNCYQIPGNIKTNLDAVVSNWFNTIDGMAHERVAETIMSVIGTGKPHISLAHCRKGAYGLLNSKIDVPMRLNATARRFLGIPTGWSFRHWKMITEHKWDRSEKYFGVSMVKELVEAIQPIARNLNPNFGAVSVYLAQERDDYKFGYCQGRAVVLKSSNLPGGSIAPR
jgi:surface carbohydrate biosynthesis protein